MRRRRAEKKEVLPDACYNSVLIMRFVNTLLKKGKKSTAEGIIYRAMDTIKEKTNAEPTSIIDKAVNNARPLIETKSRRVGGATYQVPIEVTIERGESLAVRWILDSARGP